MEEDRTDQRRRGKVLGLLIVPGASGEGGKWFKVLPLIFFSFLSNITLYCLQNIQWEEKLKLFTPEDTHCI